MDLVCAIFRVYICSLNSQYNPFIPEYFLITSCNISTVVEACYSERIPSERIPIF